MSAELQKLGQELIDRGYIKGGMIIKAQAPILEEAELIPSHLTNDGSGPLALGRKSGPATFEIDQEALRETRLGNEFSQRSLARQAGLSVAFISGIERGKHGHISEKSAHRLAEGLGVDLESLRKEVAPEL